MGQGTLPHVMEPTLPGVVDTYVDLGQFYDRDGLLARREEIRAAYGYRRHYKRAERYLGAAAQLMEDDKALLSTPGLETKTQKRVRGILSREVKRSAVGGAGLVGERFLSAVTCEGTVYHWETVDALCHRVYELVDSWGLGEGMLRALAEGCRAAGHDVILCLHPLIPRRVEHVLVPGLSLAFVTGTPEHPYPGRPYRRVRVDAMVEEELAKRNRARLKFSRRVSGALLEEGIDSMAAARKEHDELEALYHPFVDFSGVEREAERIAKELLEEN